MSLNIQLKEKELKQVIVIGGRYFRVFNYRKRIYATCTDIYFFYIIFSYIHIFLSC